MGYWPSDAKIGENLVRALDDEDHRDHCLLTGALVYLQQGQLEELPESKRDKERRRALLACTGAESLAEIGHLRLIPPRDKTWPLATTSIAEESLAPHLHTVCCTFYRHQIDY